MLSKSCVYWIHLPEHTDIFTQGYVGVSKSGLVKRYREHKHAAIKGSSLPIHNAIRKYGDELVAEVVVFAESLYCYELECKLRPSPNTGYNVSIGGVKMNLGSKRSEKSRAKMSESQKAKAKPSKETLERMSQAQLGRKMSEETILKMREAASKRSVSGLAVAAAAKHNKNLPPWKNPNSDKNIWFDADSIFQLMQDFPDYGQRKLSHMCGYSTSQLLVIYKKIKAGWNPKEDTEWLIFSGKLTPDTSGDKSIQSGISPILT